MTTNSDVPLSLLDIDQSVPLDYTSMARSLKVAFYPPHEETPRLNRFSRRLRSVFSDMGAEVVPFEEALMEGSDDRIEPGYVIIEQGEGKFEDLAVHHLTSLYKNIIVTLYDRPSPIDDDDSPQKKLDTIVENLAWNMTHIPVFVDDSSWTVCTMAGSVIPHSHDETEEAARQMLAPKLTAQITPPDRETITYRVGALDVEGEGLTGYVDDFMASATIWEENGLMLAHTSLDDVPYRNRFCKRITAAFLDERSGMSYGFLVRQLPIEVEPAMRYEEAPDALRSRDWDKQTVQSVDDQPHALVDINDESWIVPIPDVWVLSTRSGCEKTNIDPSCDLVRMGLERGEIVFETSEGVTASDAQPSYDTLAILSHATGNAIVASISKALGRNATYVDQLEDDGFSISHWHGYPPNGVAPDHYLTHGSENPPVSCSTPQSAVFSMTGKLEAFAESLRRDAEYWGDVHIEPYHGTNVSGVMNLEDAAIWVDTHCHTLLDRSRPEPA